MSSAIGLHSGAFSVGRAEILAWLNQLLQLNYTKIEEVSNGAAFCQLADILFPGSIPMSKVNFDAKFEYDSVKNFKFLQNCFTKNSIDKVIDVDKLVKGRQMDNLEFSQWFKFFFEQRTGGGELEYDAAARRAKSKATTLKKGGSAATRAAPASSSRTAPASSSRAAPASSNRAPLNRSTAANVAGARREATAKKTAKAVPQVNAGAIAAVKAELAESRIQLDTVTRERDFYFGKLREVEIICQDNEDAGIPIIKTILDILYATGEEEEEEAVEAATEEEEVLVDSENVTPEGIVA